MTDYSLCNQSRVGGLVIMAVELGENMGLVVAVVIRLYFLFSCESQFVSGEFIEH